MTTETEKKEEPKYRTITLTDRAPVRIREDRWPVLARASYHDYEGEHSFQSFRHWRGSIVVRQHDDGRTIVYAYAEYDTAYPKESGYVQHAGEMLASATTEEIVSAIHRVHASIHVAADREDWRLLADQCIADLPAEELDAECEHPRMVLEGRTCAECGESCTHADTGSEDDGICHDPACPIHGN